MLLALRSVESLLISYPAAVLKYLSWGLVWAAGMSITQAEVSGKAGEGWPGCVGEALGTWLFSRSYKGWVALDVLALELWLGSLFPYLLHPLN